MARRWTRKEENKYRVELFRLYIKQNKSLREVAEILNISEKTVFQRLSRFSIKTQPHLKEKYLKKRKDIKLPKKYSRDLAEFFGIMLGDGHLSHFQVVVNLGNKESSYANYVSLLIKKIFKIQPKISIRKTGYRDVYFGSTLITSWLLNEGLVHNKVKSQVGVPKWIFTNRDYMKAFLRGFFDTDGSVYKLRCGVQISFTNYSYPILLSLQKMLFKLRYKSSNVSSDKIYLTKIDNIIRFFREIKPKNQKHQKRFRDLINA